MTVAGTVEEFDRGAFKASVAKALDVSGASILLDVQPASVVVEAQVTTAGAEEQARLVESVTTLVSDLVAASAALGVSVEAIEPLVTSSSSTASMSATGEEASGSNVGTLAATAAVVVGGLCLLACAGKLALGRIRRGRGSISQPQRVKVAAVAEQAGEPAAARPKPAQRDDEARWEWPAASVTWGRQLGRGSFGSVYVAEAGGLKLAAKRMDVAEGERDETCKTMRREALAMLCKPLPLATYPLMLSHAAAVPLPTVPTPLTPLPAVCHPHIIEIIGVILDAPSYVALLMELADLGSLRQVMDHRSDLLLASSEAQMRIALHIADGMAFLHAREPPMLHHDLKSANVLLFSGEGSGPQSLSTLDLVGIVSIRAKLCDFGLATGLNAQSTMLQSTKRGGAGGGTMAYMGPELFQGEDDDEYSVASEVYAFAIVVWELLTCKVPWTRNPDNGKMWTQPALIRAVCRGRRPELSELQAGQVLGALAQRCWNDNAAARPSFDQVKRQLRLAMRQMQELSSDAPAESEKPEPSTSHGPVRGSDSGASSSPKNEDKLSLTLRHSLQASHKADYNDPLKSFGPTANLHRGKMLLPPPPQALPSPCHASAASHASADGADVHEGAPRARTTLARVRAERQKPRAVQQAEETGKSHALRMVDRTLETDDSKSVDSSRADSSRANATRADMSLADTSRADADSMSAKAARVQAPDASSAAETTGAEQCPEPSYYI